MITRKEYMENSSEMHHKYYGQFVTESVKRLVLSEFSITELETSFTEDKWMNTLKLERWDRLFPLVPISVFNKIRESGDVNARSLANSVCVLKAAARILIEENENEPTKSR